MLGLTQQVGRAKLGVGGGFIGDDHGLGRACEKVDPHAAEQLALGLGHIGVAGADQHVDGLDRLGPDRHGAHGLHAAQHIDLMRAAHLHGGHDGRMRFALHGRGAGDDARHARHRCRQHRHMRAGDHRELAAGHIAADRLHRDVAMAQNDAGQGFHLDIRHRGALRLGKAADLGLGETDILHVACADLLHRRRDLGRAQPKLGRVVLVEPHRQVAHRGIAARLDIGQHLFHGGAHARVILGPLAFGLAALEIGYGHRRLLMGRKGPRSVQPAKGMQDAFGRHGHL